MARGLDRQKLKRKAIQYEINKSYAHLVETIIESTFQPILQWYIVFPGVYSLFQEYGQDGSSSTKENLRRSFFNERSFKNVLEFSSWLLSLISLSWSFTSYHSVMKKGAMSPDVNPIRKGLVFLSNLCLIFVRMNFVIFFMYSWGPGQFYPGVIAILAHVIIMGSLHMLFVKHEANPCSSKIDIRTKIEIILKGIYIVIVNGLTNIYCHRFVETKTEQKSKSFILKKPTFVRQVVFETIFLVENIAITITASMSIPVKPFDDFNARSHIFALLFFIQFIGLSFKIIYYKFFHIWKDITTRFDFQTGSFYRVDRKLDYGCTSC